LGALYRKGLTEETTTWIVSDGRTGLESALDSPCYGVPHQRGLLHKIKHLTDHLVCKEVWDETDHADAKAERQAKQARKKAI
jgi:hypothetical protein